MSKYKLLAEPSTNYKASKNLKLFVDSYFLSLAHSDTSGFNVCPFANRVNKKENNKNKSNCSAVCVAKNGKGNIPVVKNARTRKTKLFSRFVYLFWMIFQWCQCVFFPKGYHCKHSA